MVWIKPIESLGLKGNWIAAKSNTFFQLEKQKSLLSKSFRIVLKRQKNSLVVATSDNESQINEHWAYIDSHLLQNISEDPEERDDVLKYLELKFESLFKTEEDEIHTFFRQTFELKDETVLDYYSCTLWKGLHRPGSLYVTSNFLCFTSKMMRHNVIIPFKEVTAMRKEGLVNKSIQISTKAKQFYFAALFKRDIAFSMIEQLWRGAVDALLVTAETAATKIDKSIGMSSSFELQKATNFDTPNKPRVLSYSGGTQRSIQRRRASIADINIEKKNEDFRTLFKFPGEESIVGEYMASMPDGDNNTVRKGLLYISQHFCSFEARQDSETVQLVIPLVEVKNITKELLVAKDKSEAILFHIDDTSKFVFYPTTQADEVFKLATRLWNVVQAMRSKEEASSLLVFLQTKTDTPFYDAQSQVQKQNWDRYLTRYKRIGFCVLREMNSLKVLLQNGMPEHLRPVMWPVCSGSLYKWVTQPGQYHELCNLYNNDESSISMTDIDKDLHRSFPFHPFFQKKENLQILRRILVAYSWRNSSIGYTQSMNIVCAQLLLVMGEESAFWLLATICEDLVPEHYSKLLLGPIVDQQLLENHLKNELPDIFQHFEEIGFSLGVLTYGWFMCLFVGYLPLEGSMRIFDMFCIEGKKVLFQVGLAIFKINREFLLHERDPMKIVKDLKDKMMEPSFYKDILKVAFEEYDHIIMEDSSVLAYRFAAIKTLENNNKSNQIHTLKSATHFTSQELDSIHQSFHSLVSIHSSNPVLTRSAFEQLFTEYPQVPVGFVKHLRENTDTRNYIWKNIRVSADDDNVEFEKFVEFLSKICKDSLSDRFELFLNIFDGDNDGFITKSETIQLVEAFISLLNKEDSISRIKSFVDMIFDQIQETNEFEISNESETELERGVTRSSSLVSLSQSRYGVVAGDDPVQDEMKVSFSVMKRELVTNHKLTGMFRLEPLKSLPANVNTVERILTRSRSNTVC